MSDTNAPEQIIINGQEFSIEDAQRLIDLGKSREELEKNLNTSLDKVVPEYTKATQKLASLEKVEQELAETKGQLEEYQKKQAQAEIPSDITQAREAARKIGLLDEDYLNQQGYVKKTDLDEYFNQKQTQQIMADNILKQCTELEKSIDGSDGRVPFDTDAVLSYASVKNIADPLEAYKQMNKRGNAKWEEAELAKAEKPGLTTLKGSGKKVPSEVKITNDNLGSNIDEWLKESGLGQD